MDAELDLIATVATGGNLGAVVAADLNGDGFADLALPDANSNKAVIYSNNRDGTFATNPARISVGTLPVAIVVGNFVDSVGDPDLIVLNSYSAAVAPISVLRNDGGTFTPLPASLVSTVPASPTPILVAMTAIDFNRDGRLDVAALDGALGKVYLFQNNGGGAFLLAQTLTGMGNNPTAIISGQFNDDNGDGRRDELDRPDLAVTTYGDVDGSGALVTVLLNQGGGDFNANHVANIGQGTVSLVAADVDGDEDDDIVVVNYASNNGLILRNDSAGTFSPGASAFATGLGPSAIVAQDMDADGDPDLLIANANTQKVSLLRNNGAGVFALNTFSPQFNFPPSVYVTLSAGDFNNDDVVDVVLAHGVEGVLNVLQNTLVPGGRRIALIANESNQDFAFQSPGAFISGRNLFYGNSAFDTGQGAANSASIATDKLALRPGQTASFDNYTSYTRRHQRCDRRHRWIGHHGAFRGRLRIPQR